MTASIGARLRTTRQARGLAIEKVAQELHIRQKYLEALEADRRQELPSAVQGKGFLRLYAGYLNLPLQPLLDAFDGKTPLAEVGPEPPAEEPAEAVPPPVPVTAPRVSQPITAQTAPLPEPAVRPEPLVVPPVEAEEPAADSTARSDFEAVGSELRAQRLALGLSLPEVERYTHVRLHYLQALEDGRIQDLPSPVQGRGMLSNYAHFLNLDVDDLLLRFAEGLQNRRIERLVEKPARQSGRSAARQPAQPKTGPRRLFSPDLLIGLVLIFIIFGFALWTAAQVDALQAREVVVTPPSIADVLLNNPTVTAAATTTGTPQALLSTLSPGEAQGARGTLLPTLRTSPQAGGTAPIQLVVVALQRAYLRITVDGKIVFDARVVPGNAYPFSGEKKVELLTGNAAALQVMYNQKDLGVLGQVGQVRSMEFSKDVVLTPTLRATATATRTTTPSPTLRPSPSTPTPSVTPYIP